MSGPAPFFIAAGLLLLLLLAFMTRRRRGVGAGGEQLGAAEEVLTALQSELLPVQLVERIFSPEDWKYVFHEASADIREVFHKERKALALSWLRRTHRQVVRLMDLHVRIVRGKADLNPAAEMRLAADYVLFQLLYALLLTLLWVQGPVHTRKMVGYAVGLAGQLCVISEGFLASVRPVLVKGPEPDLNIESSER